MTQKSENKQNDSPNKNNIEKVAGTKLWETKEESIEAEGENHIASDPLGDEEMFLNTFEIIHFSLME